MNFTHVKCKSYQQDLIFQRFEYTLDYSRFFTFDTLTRVKRAFSNQTESIWRLQAKSIQTSSKGWEGSKIHATEH